MNVCGTCKHWTLVTNEYEHIPDFVGECGSEKFVDCSCDYPMEIGTPHDGVGYSDKDSYSAMLRTGKDFGCIHWEAR